MIRWHCLVGVTILTEAFVIVTFTSGIDTVSPFLISAVKLQCPHGQFHAYSGARY